LHWSICRTQVTTARSLNDLFITQQEIARGKELHIGERRYYELIASETRKQLEDAYPNVTVSGLKVGAEEYRELLADLHAARSKPTK